VVNADGNDILLANLKTRSNVIGETGVPIRMFPEVCAVDPHFAVAIHSIELESNGLAFVTPGDVK
jgi:hypothetical protein